VELLPFSLLVQAYNDLFKEMERDIDMLGFLKCFAIDPSLAWSFRARQIDQVQLRNSFYVLSNLLGLQLENKDAV